MKEFVPKIFDVMKTYSKGQFIKDVVAGIIVAITLWQKAKSHALKH